MKYILLAILCLNLIGCADSPDNPIDKARGNDVAPTCEPSVNLAIHCSLDCDTGMYVQDFGVDGNPVGVRRYFRTELNCQRGEQILREVATPWISAGR